MRHMIVVDHSHRNIIMSIRGTFSLSEIAVDMAAFSRTLFERSPFVVISRVYNHHRTLLRWRGPLGNGQYGRNSVGESRADYSSAQDTTPRLSVRPHWTLTGSWCRHTNSHDVAVQGEG
jgi:hypothetical protein